ncbi:MAG: carbohydrate kinase family protein [Rhodospirillum sp.]|nr:carbohydrate kinase family protein [Rhodospirillum sp.]MCF8487679.1 carbohydrate kinase family protein [Rhodospirillum sp.]MCF8499575.1 carbohydrate kinase family protein [Rhodospirillum sp.]
MQVLTIGGAMIDTIAIIDSDRIERMVMFNAESSYLLLEEGGKTEAQEVSTHTGGGAVNCAISMARLGLDVSTLVKLGQDERAETIMARLMDEGVSTRWISRDGRAPTGASVLISSHDRNAAIFTFRGANSFMEPVDLREDAFAVDVVYIASLTNKSAECFPLIIEKAKAHGAKVAANPGIRQLSAYGPAFQECLKGIDILSINRKEAGALVPHLVARVGEGGPSLPLGQEEDPPLMAARGLNGGGFDMSLSRFCQAVTDMGPSHVVLTDGGRGAFVATEGEILHCPAMKGDVVGTAGAGDAFASTFTAFLAMGHDAEESLRAATYNAAAVVGHIDTQTGLHRKDDILNALEGTGAVPRARRWTLKG